MAKDNLKKQWQRADEAVRNNLPPGVKLVRTLRDTRTQSGALPGRRMGGCWHHRLMIRLFDFGTLGRESACIS